MFIGGYKENIYNGTGMLMAIYKLKIIIKSNKKIMKYSRLMKNYIG